MRRAKILATLGPSCNTPEVLEEMINSGVDVCRINFSYGTQRENKKLIDMVRKTADKVGKAVSIMLAIQGPKIRIGELKQAVTIEKDDTVILSGNSEHKESLYLPTTYPNVASDTKKGKTILINDGKVILRVLSADPASREVKCKVENGGSINTGNGINLPYTDISLPALTEKDIRDVKFGIKAGVDFMSLSFVRKPKDILRLRSLLEEEGHPEIPIIAKIEKPEALQYIDEIINISEGIMIARGDLGDEIPIQRVPAVQKEIIKETNLKGKFSIVATEMLSSMVNEPRPTRAEASDVANAVLDGTDVLFMSNETATGKYPIKAVKMMDSIIKATEKSFHEEYFHSGLDLPEVNSLYEGLCSAASQLSFFIGEKANLVISKSGNTAKILSKYRPQTPIYSVTDDKRTYNRMALYNNVLPILIDKRALKSTRPVKVQKTVETELKKQGYIKTGDKLIVLTGVHDDEDIWKTNAVTVWIVN
ncbi:MAG: pyruvate kinase [Victivallales bacterium]|nr:pyruvate kinase [Victivallales bacterium]